MMKLLIKRTGLLLALCLPLIAQAKTSVWQVTKGDNTIYIGGTVHILPADAFPLPPEFKYAYDRADKVAFEVDMSLMNQPETQQKMQSAMFIEENKTLASVINPQALSALEAYAKANGLPFANLQRLKPAMISVMISMMEMRKLGVAGEGVDAFYDKLAKNDGKERLFLESIDFQIETLLSMGQGQESELILMTLEQVSDYKTMLDSMLKGWREGDHQLVVDTVIKPAKEQSPQLYQQLFVERNNNWIAHIDKMMADKPVELVLVGAGHLYGKESVIELLKNKGYKIKQLNL
ncbi:TraB/GumN family protein [Psychrobium sp. 1_MG-2023]|uniref:TraB/GumN family protein n=1 Tax=Psychrobium sp. 1_MG-2023 TaxID=3062624 RepID=UPI000C3414B8|nr:TraB/GumN family protein [Psychrobium sp. 1_MG-2023]MDP2560469.1 TraB/GumN family protein [Psychrobium sp. 1_MG-2023]PKF57871.1 TraB/GumN family protein [Alteromonadales bacterium alter-6D02]